MHRAFADGFEVAVEEPLEHSELDVGEEVVHPCLEVFDDGLCQLLGHVFLALQFAQLLVEVALLVFKLCDSLLFLLDDGSCLQLVAQLVAFRRPLCLALLYLPARCLCRDGGFAALGFECLGALLDFLAQLLVFLILHVVVGLCLRGSLSVEVFLRVVQFLVCVGLGLFVVALDGLCVCLALLQPHGFLVELVLFAGLGSVEPCFGLHPHRVDITLREPLATGGACLLYCIPLELLGLDLVPPGSEGLALYLQVLKLSGGHPYSSLCLCHLRIGFIHLGLCLVDGSLLHPLGGHVAVLVALLYLLLAGLELVDFVALPAALFKVAVDGARVVQQLIVAAS